MGLLEEKEKERNEQKKRLDKILEEERIERISRIADGLFPRYPPGTVIGEAIEEKEIKGRKKNE